jgi:predicted metal-dependent peptidase
VRGGEATASGPAAGPVADTRRTLENAVIRLLKRRPFYGHLLLGCRRRLVDGSHPLGVTLVNGTPTLAVTPGKFAAYPPGEQEALLEHALKHLLHLRLTWDVASDLAINPSITAMPAAAPRPERFGLEIGLAAEEYARLLAARFELGTLDGEGLGNASQDPGGQAGAGDEQLQGAAAVAPVDDHAIWSEADSTPERLAEQAVRDLVREAHRKAHAEVPDELRALVQGWLAPSSIPWREVLRQFVGNAGRTGKQNTWQREHRRFEHITPGMRKRRQLNLLVAIDVSESTDRQVLREAFARELLRIARSRASRITVLYAHSRIRRIDSFRSSQAVAEVVHGGGFTDLPPVFDHAKQPYPRPAAVIYLTDGEGPAPEAMDFPTLWVLTPDGRKPVKWGVEMRLNDGF